MLIRRILAGLSALALVLTAVSTHPGAASAATYTPNGVLYAWQTADINANAWSAVNQRAYTQPLNSRHATITPITAEERTALLTRWGAPSWNRLKSYTPPRPVHQALELPAADRPDQQRLVGDGQAGRHLPAAELSRCPSMAVRRTVMDRHTGSGTDRTRQHRRPVPSVR